MEIVETVFLSENVLTVVAEQRENGSLMVVVKNQLALKRSGLCEAKYETQTKK